MNPTGPRDADGKFQIVFRNSEVAADSSCRREPEATPHPHLLGSRFFAWFPRGARSRGTLLPVRHLVLLREFSALSACCEILHGVLSHILPPTNVDRFKPALLPPAPGRACRNANLFQPPGQTDDCTALIYFRKIRIHAATLRA